MYADERFALTKWHREDLALCNSWPCLYLHLNQLVSELRHKGLRAGRWWNAYHFSSLGACMHTLHHKPMLFHHLIWKANRAKQSLQCQNHIWQKRVMHACVFARQHSRTWSVFHRHHMRAKYGNTLQTSHPSVLGKDGRFVKVIVGVGKMHKCYGNVMQVLLTHHFSPFGKTVSAFLSAFRIPPLPLSDRFDSSSWIGSHGYLDFWNDCEGCCFMSVFFCMSWAYMSPVHSVKVFGSKKWKSLMVIG